jgi:dolichol-phosphate mannosyltransferase
VRPEKQTLVGSGENLLTLVIPTRNEAANIARLARELKESLSGVNYRVVFVDDSLDRTPEAIRALGEKDSRIFLIHK